jgi:hypothetical protein
MGATGAILGSRIVLFGPLLSAMDFAESGLFLGKPQESNVCWQLIRQVAYLPKLATLRAI